MMKGEKWFSHAGIGHVRSHGEQNPRDLFRPVTRFRNSSKEFRESCWRLVRHSRDKTLNISGLFTDPERLLFSVSMMLISGATFLMCFIFVIPAGLIQILMLLITIANKSGRKIRKLVSRKNTVAR